MRVLLQNLSIPDLKNEELTEVVKFIAKKLKKGSVAVLPTSTIYGLSCVYNNKEAIDKIYDIKKRPKNLPFIVLISKISQLDSLIEEKTNLAEKLIEKYWISENPQPLTLVFKKAKIKKKNLKKDKLKKDNHQKDNFGNTIAVRLDPLPIINKIINLSGPLISTSATISGTNLSPRTINEIPEEVLQKVDLVLDYEKKLSGTASTIIDVSTENPIILRQGSVKIQEQ